jgi:peptidase E
MDDFVLGLTGRDTPRVCFLPTASGDAEGYIERFHAAFGGGRAAPSHLALFRREVDDLERFLLEQDVVYVGGGNTANMLAVWRLHGVDAALARAWREGVLLCGLSAGGLCWFEDGTTDSFGGVAPLHDGLGLLPGSFCPHFDSEPLRRPQYRRFVADGLADGFAADDAAALRFEGRELAEVVVSTPGARAYRVERVAGEVVERPLDGRLLSC